MPLPVATAFLLSGPPGARAHNPRNNSATMQDQSKISVRCQAGNANHHLWNNNGTWWCHFTLHLPDFTKRRLRRSVGTACIEEARYTRDFLLAVLPQQEVVA